ncbi:MAG: hypothetical protein IIV90_01815 [Oscillospiraceae bacterium]|nr:hypothetical protein [Oscillospiraceae bacterium]
MKRLGKGLKRAFSNFGLVVSIWFMMFITNVTGFFARGGSSDSLGDLLGMLFYDIDDHKQLSMRQYWVVIGVEVGYDVCLFASLLSFLSLSNASNGAHRLSPPWSTVALLYSIAFPIVFFACVFAGPSKYGKKKSECPSEDEAASLGTHEDNDPGLSENEVSVE